MPYSLGDLLGELLHRLFVADVDRFAPGRRGADQPGHLRRPGRALRVPVHGHHPGTRLGEGESGGPADAPGRARHEDQLSAEPVPVRPGRRGVLHRSALGPRRLVGGDELADPGGDPVRPGARHPVLCGQRTAYQLRCPQLQLVVQLLRQEDVAGRCDQLDRYMRIGVGTRSAQPGSDVVAVEPGAVRRVAGQGGRRIVARRHLLQPLEDPRPLPAERAAPGELGQDRRMQHVDVPGLGALSQQLADAARGGPGHPLLDPVAEVVQGGPGHRGERGDPALGPLDRGELPGLDRPPVVPDQVHRPVRAHRIDDGQEVIGELLQGEAPRSGFGAVDRPCPRTSYSTTCH